MTAKRTSPKRKTTKRKKSAKAGGTQCGSHVKSSPTARDADPVRATDGKFLPGSRGGPGRGRGTRNFKSRLLDAIKAYEAEQGIDLFAEIVRQARWDKSLIALLVNKTIPTPAANAIEGEDLMAVIEMFETIEDKMTSSTRKFADIQESLDVMRDAVTGLRRVACKALGIPIEQKVTIKWVKTDEGSNGNGRAKLRPARV